MSHAYTCTLQELKSSLSTLSRATLAHLPTPLDTCARLGRELGGIDLRIKRDDATGLALGGNKVRQLEYILGDALRNGHDAVIQGAASQSNHSRQLAAAGARLGVEVHLTPWQDARSSPIQGNYLLSHLYGANLHPIPPGASSKEAKAKLAERLRTEGKNPYIVGMGAQDALVLAAVAYIGAYVELIEQLDGIAPDWIFATSQGSTQAGLVVASRLLGHQTQVIGINPMGPDHEAYTPVSSIHQMAVDAAKRLGLEVNVDERDIVNLTNYVGDSYGVPSQAGLAALDRLAQTEGVLLDPVYSSKGFAGLLDHAQQGFIEPGSVVVFLHTGGLPGVFAYAEDVVSAAQPQHEGSVT